ncbi:hypothetical protein Tco_0246710, partial [Tanacetum coccineum]
MEQEIKQLKRSRIPLVKVRWNSKRGSEFTWECEDSFKEKYPQLFTNRASSSTTRVQLRLRHTSLDSSIHKQNRTNHKDHQNCLFACFLSQEEPKTISQALKDESWVEAMQEELLQFKLQQDVVHGHGQEEESDYDEVFTPVDRMRQSVFLAFASYKGFLCLSEDDLLTKDLMLPGLTFGGQHWNVKSVVTFDGDVLLLRLFGRLLSFNTGSLIVNSSKLQLVDATGIHNLSDAKIYVGLATLEEGQFMDQGSAEASMQLRELMVLVPTLVTRINSLEKELKDTKQTLGNAVLKLVKKVKSLETALKRKSKKVIVSESESEEPEDQGRIIQDIDDDPLVSLVRESMKEKSTDFVTPTKASGEAQEEEISPTILEAAKTLSKVASQGVSKEKSTDKGKRYRRRARSVAKNINIGLDAKEEINTGIKDVNTGSTKVDSGTASKRGQREGKAPMVEEDIQATHKTKEQMRQEEAGLEEAIKLQAQLDEEVAKQIHLDKMTAKRMAEEEALTEQQKKRIAKVQFEAQFYTEEDWDAIRAKLEANAKLSKDVLRIYMSNYHKNQGTWKLSQLKKLKFE